MDPQYLGTNQVHNLPIPFLSWNPSDSTTTAKGGGKLAKVCSQLDLMQAINTHVQPSEETTPTSNKALQHNPNHSANSPCTEYHMRHGQVAETEFELEIDRHGNHPEVHLLQRMAERAVLRVYYVLRTRY
jgi:hypothetical protein